VAARDDDDDVVTGKRIKAVTTAQIYKGSIAFIILQIIMVSVIVFNPTIVTGSLEEAVKVDDATVNDMLRNMPGLEEEEPEVTEESDAEPAAEGDPAPEPAATEDAEPDPMKAMEEALKKTE
jgi:hypothetical protein